MKNIKVQSVCYPNKTMSYNAWCKKFKVGSRCNKKDPIDYYDMGDYDTDKLIKMIKGYEKINEKKSVLSKIGEALLALCKGQVQKARNKISIA